MLLKRISKFFICTIIAAAVIVQCGCSALNFRYEYDRGMKAYNEKNYDEAIKLKERFKITENKEWDAITILAELNVQLGHFSYLISKQKNYGENGRNINGKKNKKSYSFYNKV